MLALIFLVLFYILAGVSVYCKAFFCGLNIGRYERRMGLHSQQPATRLLRYHLMEPLLTAVVLVVDEALWLRWLDPVFFTDGIWQILPLLPLLSMSWLLVIMPLRWRFSADWQVRRLCGRLIGLGLLRVLCAMIAVGTLGLLGILVILMVNFSIRRVTALAGDYGISTSAARPAFLDTGDQALVLGEHGLLVQPGSSDASRY